MLFYTISMVLTILIVCSFIGLYYFSKQNYNNFFVRLLLNGDKIKLLESKKVNKRNWVGINFILSIETILISLLMITFIYVFQSYNFTLRYIIIVLVLVVKIASNKFIEINLKHQH